MDYGKKEGEYKEEEKPSDYYIVEPQKEKDEQKPAVDFNEMIRNIPKGGSIAVMPEYYGGVIYFTSLDTHLYAVEASSGKMIWKFKTGGPSVSATLIHNKKIYFGSHDEYFYCLDLSGKLLWKKHLGDIVPCYPTAFSNNIFVTSGKNMFCFSEDGTQKWKFATGGGTFATPALINGFVSFSSFDGYTYCLDVEGNLRWKFFTGGYASSPVVFSDNKSIVTIKKRSWDKMPEASNPILCIATGNNFLYALTIDGRPIWKYNMGSSAASIPFGADNLLYTGTVSGHVHAINVENGKCLWKFRTGGMVTAAPILSEDKIYFGSWDQKFYCLANEGTKIWEFLTGGPIVAECAIVGDRIYFGSADTFLYCINSNKRTVEWTFQCGFGLPENLQAKLSDINNTLVEFDRKVFKVWKPETSKASVAFGGALQNYQAPAGFEFGGEQVYRSSDAYKAGDLSYFGKKKPYKH